MVEQKGGRVIEPIWKRVFLRGMLRYLRPDFHPNDTDHSGLIARALARLEAEGVLGAARGGAARDLTAGGVAP